MYSLPSTGRQLFRRGELFKSNTFGTCPEFVQANLSILPVEFAEDFAKFCRENSAPCPVIFRSSPGQYSAPPLATDSDVRSDVPSYEVYRDGVPGTEPIPDLKSFPWDDMVSFYLGCSYTFDSKLLSSGIVIKSPSMHRTNIPCIPCGPFSCNMVVTMRPIPADKVELAVELSSGMDFCHGAPIHIGNPADIGLESISPGILKSDIKDDGLIGEDEIPCFWACGVTGNTALRDSKLPISFSHSPGSMFITDVPSEEGRTLGSFAQYPPTTVVCTNPELGRYVTLSKITAHKLDAIEHCISFDPGNRHTDVLVIQGELTRACLELSMRARKVGILVGFPLFDTAPAEENDGIAGALYLTRGLQAIGAEVVFIVDSTAVELISFLDLCQSEGFIHENITCIKIGKGEATLSNITSQDSGSFSHLIAIERPSPATDGKYYTMKARDISDKVGGMAGIFRQATSDPDITTIGIGDGGNELGMGKVKDGVTRGIPHGDVIAADVSADLLVSCGVSNWGGLAIAAGLHAVRSCPVHDRYRRRGRGSHTPPRVSDFLLTRGDDERLHTRVMEIGFRDGCTGEVALTVDSLDYTTFHANMLTNIRCHVE